jgi:chemotaxis signal transduction protein
MKTSSTIFASSYGSQFAEPQVCEKYCVFERGGTLYAILATSVREISLRPRYAQIPDSHPMLLGLAHLRNEFLPLVRDEEPTGLGNGRESSESQVVVVTSENGPWGLLVDRVVGLVPLEMSLCTDVLGSRGWAASVMGSATLDHRIVRVLDERSLYRKITEEFNRYWTCE